MTSVVRDVPSTVDLLPQAPLRHVRLSVFRLYVRLVRRGLLLVVLGTAVYILVEALSYLQTYPDAASRSQLAVFADEPAVRMLQGVPHAVEAVGGFVVWDGGWFLQAIIGVWAIMTTSRLLRGEEDSERIELVGVGPISLTRATWLAVLIVVVGCAFVGVTVSATMFASGGQGLGSLLFGFGIMGFGVTFVAVTALVSQLFGVRRRAVGVSATMLGAAFLVRMVANSTDDRSWISWFTPYGWLDRMRPFGDNNVGVLLVYVVVPVVLLWWALALRARRDTGAAIIGERAEPRSHLRLLGRPLAFAWRSSRAVLLAWAVGLGLYAFMMGTLIQTMAEFLAEDPNYRKTLEDLGMSAANSAEGMVGLMGIVEGLVICLYIAWRIGAARQEESSERVEHLLTRPVPRWRWLGGHVLIAAASATALAVISGAAIWLGAAPTDADLSLEAAVASVTNLLPTVAVVGGLAVAAFGTWPRLTVGLPVGFIVVSYVLEIVGPAFDWPGWVVGISPFHHVAYVPAQAFEPVPAAIMVALGALLAVVGLLAFERRDLVGA